MMNCSTDVALNFAADLFEASPRHTFTREEIVRTLRLLPDEMRDVEQEVEAIESALEGIGTPS